MSDPVPTPKTKRLSGGRVLGLAAVIVGFLLVILVINAVVQDNPRTRAHQISKAQRQRIGYRRSEQAKMSDSALRATFHGLSASEARAKWEELSRLGVRRLSEKDQVRRIAQFGAMLSAMPEEACANEEWGETVMLGLDSAGVEELIARDLAGIQAEIRDTAPALRTDSTAIAWARQTVKNSLTPEGRRIFSDAVLPLAEADYCVIARVMYGRISALPESHQADYARAITTLEASHYEERMRRVRHGKRFISP